MSIDREYAKEGTFLCYGDEEYNTFTIFEEANNFGGVIHRLTYCVKNGKTFCRENDERGLKPFGEISLAGAVLAQKGCTALGVTL